MAVWKEVAMKRSVKLIVAMAALAALIVVLVFAASTKSLLKLSTSITPASSEAVSRTITAERFNAVAMLAGQSTNTACQSCQDSCVRQYGLTQNALEVCDIQCSDKCKDSSGGGKDKNKKKLKYKLRK